MRRWVLVRQTRRAPEDEAIVAALALRAASDGARLSVALLGSATYDLVGPVASSSARPGAIEVLALREEAEGRGVGAGAAPGARLLDYRELVRLLFEADRVIQVA